MNAGMRYIYGIRKREHITPFRSSLQWLTIEGRRKYFAAILLYRMFVTNKPQYLVKRDITNVSNRPVRGYKLPLCIPSHKKEFLENSFLVKSTCLWKSLPPPITECKTIGTFKRCIYSYILSLKVGQTPLLQAHLQRSRMLSIDYFFEFSWC